MNRPVKKGGAQIALYAGLLLFVVLAMTGLRYCSNPPAGAEKERRESGGDTIDVAISYSPVTLYRYADTLGGLGYDMMRALSAQDGFVFKFHPVTSLEQSMKGLEDGLYDLVVYDTAKTADTDERFAFTEPVSFDKQVLVQRRDSAGNVPVGSQLELARKRVWVEAESPAILRLKHLSAEIGDTIFVEPVSDYTSEQLFIMAAIGEVPLAVVNESVARKLAGEYPQVDISTGVSFTQFQAWLMRSDDSTRLHRLNQSIVKFKSTPAYTALISKY